MQLVLLLSIVLLELHSKNTAWKDYSFMKFCIWPEVAGFSTQDPVTVSVHRRYLTRTATNACLRLIWPQTYQYEARASERIINFISLPHDSENGK